MATNNMLPTDECEYWEVRQLSSHNAYDHDDFKADLKDQADIGIRSFEFDIHNESLPWLGVGNYRFSFQKGVKT